MSLIDELYDANVGQRPVSSQETESLLDSLARMQRRLMLLEVAQEHLRVVFYEQKNLSRPLREAIKEILDV